MSHDEILQKIETCFKTVFTEEFSFSKDLDRDNFEQWDSLHHINLLIELEKSFSIRFDGATATILTSVDNISTEIADRLEQ